MKFSSLFALMVFVSIVLAVNNNLTIAGGIQKIGERLGLITTGKPPTGGIANPAQMNVVPKSAETTSKLGQLLNNNSTVKQLQEVFGPAVQQAGKLPTIGEIQEVICLLKLVAVNILEIAKICAGVYIAFTSGSFVITLTVILLKVFFPSLREVL